MAPRVHLALLAGLAACGFDTSGLTDSASAGMSIGEVGSAPTDSDASSGASQSSADPTTIGSADSADTGSSGGSPLGCEACGTPAPAGWTGPFAIATASPPNPALGCAQGWAEHAYAFGGLQAGPALCGCECVPSQGTCNINVSYYSDQACAMATEGGASSGNCDAMSTGQEHDYRRASAVIENVACVPSPSTVIPPTAWSDAAVLCAPLAASSCDDGTPCLPMVPPGFDGRWCVVADGEQACPGGVYSEASVMHRSLTDTRECSPCGCNVQNPPVCNGTLREYADSFCLVGIGIPIDEACHPSGVGGQGNWSIGYDGSPPSFTCVSNGPVPGGAATATEPVTICCAP